MCISLLNIDRFSQFFHRRTQLELCNKIINKDPTSPQMCCYTTLSILESCCLRPMMRNSVLEELRVRRFAPFANVYYTKKKSSNLPIRTCTTCFEKDEREGGERDRQIDGELY